MSLEAFLWALSSSVIMHRTHLSLRREGNVRQESMGVPLLRVSIRESHWRDPAAPGPPACHFDFHSACLKSLTFCFPVLIGLRSVGSEAIDQLAVAVLLK